MENKLKFGKVSNVQIAGVGFSPASSQEPGFLFEHADEIVPPDATPPVSPVKGNSYNK